MTGRVSLYEDEAGGLYLRHDNEAFAFLIGAYVVADLEEVLAAVNQANVFEALAVELDALFGTGEVWTDAERIPLERLGSTLPVAAWSDFKVEVYDGSRPDTAPPGPNGHRVLRNLGSNDE